MLKRTAVKAPYLCDAHIVSNIRFDFTLYASRMVKSAAAFGSRTNRWPWFMGSLVISWPFRFCKKTKCFLCVHNLIFPYYGDVNLIQLYFSAAHLSFLWPSGVSIHITCVYIRGFPTCMPMSCRSLHLLFSCTSYGSLYLVCMCTSCGSLNILYICTPNLQVIPVLLNIQPVYTHSLSTSVQPLGRSLSLHSTYVQPASQNDLSAPTW